RRTRHARRLRGHDYAGARASPLNARARPPPHQKECRRMTPYTRRSLLVSTGLAAAAVGLAGCRSEGPQPAAPSAGPAAIPLAQVPVGGGVILQDGAYVVTQPTAGEVKAFTKVCTHQHCPVSRI